MQLALEGTDHRSLGELGEWLRAEVGLRGKVRAAPSQPAAETMGAVGDALVVAVGSGGALSVLLSSLKAWLAQPKRSDIRIEMRTPDGRTLLVDAKRLSNPEDLVREVLRSDEAE